MHEPRRLILKCPLSPGDLVMLSAAIRDLHRTYPGQFLTDVRTCCPDLWQHNPHLTPLDEQSPDVQSIDCHYPLINRCDQVPSHCLQGFVQFLNEQLGLKIELTAFKGDIRLSRQERAWYSQVHEATGEDTPFWVINAGGKHDVTLKWWSPGRYQEVIDHFRDRILFVQVGQHGHHHPPLRGALDLRGRTSLRQLIRLIYHAQGVLSPVTAVMHFAAAIETKPDAPALRPCVVVAGGREPAHWEAYPGHQFIHTIGALPCCAKGGCWKDRLVPLGDGDSRDASDRLCLDVAGALPRCLDMISTQTVIERIETYFRGGMLRYLTGDQARAARRGIRALAGGDFDRLPLKKGHARVQFEQAVRNLPRYPGNFAGRGIVIPAGGCRLFTNAWVCIRRLRALGCTLPIEVWHLGPREMTPDMAQLLEAQGARCVDAQALSKTHPIRRLGGWELKSYALAYCRFEEVLFLDADNVPVANPEFLFDSELYLQKGAIFWPDLGRLEKTQAAWDMLGVARPDGPEFESGQMLVDKRRGWRALALALWLNENSDFFYHFVHGDKETFHLAYERLQLPYALIPTPVWKLRGTMCQHDPNGRRLFQHRNTAKWTLLDPQLPIEDFWHEDECRAALADLRASWDSRSLLAPAVRRRLAAPPSARSARPPSLQAGMISCEPRREIRRHTLRRLAATDWGEEPVLLQLDDPATAGPCERQVRASLALLQTFLDGKAEYLLFLEDDLDFNRHLRHNLNHWPLLRNRQIALAGLYNPGLAEAACDLSNRACVVEPDHVFGSQALLVSRDAARFFVAHWDQVDGMQDIRMSRLAGRFRPPVFYHAPSLVQHVGQISTWGGPFHEAQNFDPDWKAEVTISDCPRPRRNHRKLNQTGVPV